MMAQHQTLGAGRPLLRATERTLFVAGLLFILSWVLSAALQTRLSLLAPESNYWDRALARATPGAAFVSTLGGWIPRVTATRLLPLRGTGGQVEVIVVGYVLVLAVQFALYGCALRLLAARSAWRDGSRRARLPIVGAIGLACSAMMLFSPFESSHDPFAYAAIGRLLATYHENPYFVLAAKYPHDLLMAADAWSTSTSAYGPLWTALSGLVNPFVGSDPIRSIMVYRFLALLAHAANMVLIASARPSGVVAARLSLDRRLLLYAWNPLVIGEVSAAHNDVLLLTVVLVGLSLMQRGHMSGGYGSLAAAVLLKASAFPLLVVALLALCAPLPHTREHLYLVWQRVWRPASLCLGLAAIGYLPFYWGHSPGEVTNALTTAGTVHGLARALGAFVNALSRLLGSMPLLPGPAAQQLAHGWLGLNHVTLWLAGCALVLSLALLCLWPRLRSAANLPQAMTWIYATWLGYLAIINLLQPWYVVPLIGLIAFDSQGRALRRLVLPLTLLLELQVIFTLPLPVLQALHPWAGALEAIAAGLSLLAGQRTGTWTRILARHTALPHTILPSGSRDGMSPGVGTERTIAQPSTSASASPDGWSV